MVAVRKEADLASPHRRIELTFGTQICVRIAFNHLQQHRKDGLYKNNVDTHYLPTYGIEKRYPTVGVSLYSSPPGAGLLSVAFI